MKIWVHRYELKPLQSGVAARRGVLLKVEWAPGQFGYSDVHPWPELGEPELEEHIQELAGLDFTPLVESSLEFNFIDRELRDQSRNAFLGLALPRSHRLVLDVRSVSSKQVAEWHALGFTHFKVKMGGKDLAQETDALEEILLTSSMLARVDFNSRLKSADFLKWWKGLKPLVRARIDFIEDPVSDGALSEIGPWAADWKPLEIAQIKVVKPARENFEHVMAVQKALGLPRFRRWIFTHSMDHPLGQAAAVWTAARFYRSHPQMSEVCGLAMPEIYKSNEFSKVWDTTLPMLKPTPGTGFGFDDLLKNLKWERLV